MNKHTLCTASRIKAHKTMLHRATKKSHGVKRLLKPMKEILNKIKLQKSTEDKVSDNSYKTLNCFC